MATLALPRFFVRKANHDGTARHYWQPTRDLAPLGFKTQRLDADLVKAIDQAKAWNDRVDAVRSGIPLAEVLGTEPAARAGLAPASAKHIIPGSVAHGIRIFKSSDQWSRLAKKTRHDYSWNLELIERWAGDDPMRSVGADDKDTFYRALKKRSLSVANATMRVARRLWNVSIKKGLATANPFARPELEEVEREEPTLWEPELVIAYVRACDAIGRFSIGDAVVINHWLGQRKGDVLRLDRALYRDGCFHLRQNKTKARLIVPHSPLVAARVEAALKRQAEAERKIESTRIIISEETGRPYESDNFRHVFAEIRDLAVKGSNEHGLHPCPELAAVRFSWLRHTAVTELAIAGCTVAQIAAISGHSLKTVTKILDLYLIRVARLAKVAADLRLQGDALHNRLAIGDRSEG